MIRLRVLGAVCVLCVALAPAAALAARSNSRGPSSHSSSILLRGPAYTTSNTHSSIFNLPGHSAPPSYNSVSWARGIVWKPTGTVLHGRGDGPKPGNAIPEPGAALLFGIGVGLVALHLHRRPRLALVR